MKLNLESLPLISVLFGRFQQLCDVMSFKCVITRALYSRCLPAKLALIYFFLFIDTVNLRLRVITGRQYNSEYEQEIEKQEKAMTKQCTQEQNWQ